VRTQIHLLSYDVILLLVIFHQRVVITALHAMQTQSRDENSVCPSVRLSVKRVHCDKTEERSVQIFYIV